MLRVDASSLIGKPFASNASVGPLWEMLADTRRVDGAMVRLGQGSFIATARPIVSDGDEAGSWRHCGSWIARIAQRITAMRPRYVFADIIGEDAGMEHAMRLARQAAGVDASVLITGESGTGKEVFAHAIHTGGTRAAEPFVGLNCAAAARRHPVAREVDRA